MRRLLLTFLAALSLSLPGTSSDTDSLVMEDLEYLKKSVNLLIYRLNQMEGMASDELDSLKSMSSRSEEKLRQLQKQSRQQHRTLQDTIRQTNGNLQMILSYTRNALNKTNTTYLLTLGIALIMIVLLIYLLWRQRKKSIEYLVSQTFKISRQNDEMIEKTNELQGIKDVLERNLKQQKKIKKKLKKKK